MNKSKRIFAACRDMGAAGALIPVLQKLKNNDHEVTVYARQGDPARAIFEESGLALADHEGGESTDESIFDLLSVIHPNVVLTGIGTEKDGVEKDLLRVAKELRIPTAVVFETWPHHWLQNYGERDRPLYRTAARTFVPDVPSAQLLDDAGWNPACVVASGSPTHEKLLSDLLPKREQLRKEFRDRFLIGTNDTVILWPMNLDIDDPSIYDAGHPELNGVPEPVLLETILQGVQSLRRRGVENVRLIIRRKPTHPERVLRGLCDQYADARAMIDAMPGAGAPAAAMFGADLVMGTGGTTMLAQAALCGIPAAHVTVGSQRDPKSVITNAIGLTYALWAPRVEILGDFIQSFAVNAPGMIEQLKPKFNGASAMGAARRIASEVMRIAS